MKFMLMMHAPRGNGDWNVMDWAPQDLKAHIGFMKRLAQDLHNAGDLVAAEGLAPPGQARIVRAVSRLCGSRAPSTPISPTIPKSPACSR